MQQFKTEEPVRTQVHIVVIGHGTRLPNSNAVTFFNTAFAGRTRVHLMPYLTPPRGQIMDILIIAGDPRNGQEDAWLRELLERRHKDTLVIGT
jgi:hypothetical protein